MAALVLLALAPPPAQAGDTICYRLAPPPPHVEAAESCGDGSNGIVIWLGPAGPGGLSAGGDVGGCPKTAFLHSWVLKVDVSVDTGCDPMHP